MARTIHIRGLLPQDRRDDMLIDVMNADLRESNGKVLGVIMVPDFQKHFELEMKKKEIEDLASLLHIQEPCCLRTFKRKKYRSLEYFTKQKKLLDQ
jgi:hypothetical protein